MRVRFTDKRDVVMAGVGVGVLVGTVVFLGYLFMWTLEAFYPRNMEEAMEHVLRPWARLGLLAILTVLVVTTEVVAVRLWFRR